MTRQTNARVAGFAFLFYIAVGVAQMMVSRGMPAASDTLAKLAVMAAHSSRVHINMLLGILTGFTALTLGASLYGITREEDADVAILGFAFRIGEGVLVVVPTMATLGLLWLATSHPTAANAASVTELAGFLMKVKSWNTLFAATLFAAGSTLFTWLLLRGRMIPIGLAWLGVVASIALLAVLPLQLAGMITGPVTSLVWIPMALFEIPLGFWLLVKGVREINQ